MLQMIYFFSEMTSKYVGLLEILYRHFYSGMKTVEESREPHACWRTLSCPVLSRASCHLSSLGYPCSKEVEATSIEHFMQGCLSKTVTGQKAGTSLSLQNSLPDCLQMNICIYSEIQSQTFYLWHTSHTVTVLLERRPNYKLQIFT